MNGTGSTFAVGGFAGEEQRSGNWPREPFGRGASANQSVAVGPKGERIGVPVMVPTALDERFDAPASHAE